jgi:POT family proton-dependent oligopeptide transporter
MKSTIMSVWNLTVTVGNLITALITRANAWKGAMQFYAFAAMIFVAAVLFLLVSWRYKPVDHFRKA